MKFDPDQKHEEKGMRRDKSFVFTLLVLVLLLTSVPAISTVQAPRYMKTLNPTADSHVANEGPDKNWGRSWSLFVRGNGTEILAFLMFDLSQIPSDAGVEWAKLRLYASYVNIRALISVYHCPNNDWTEEGITYNNKPTFSTTPIDTANVTSINSYEWNVTGTVQSTLEAADKKLTLVLKADTHTWVNFDSRNKPYASQTRPQLVVLYQASPPSGTDPVLTTLILIVVIGAVAVGLGLSYILLKRRKPPKETANQTPHAKQL